jgi:hypothetical protein
MKLDLNLTTAFTLRKRIKELLNKINSQMIYAQYVVEPERKEEILEAFETNDVEGSYKLLTDLMEANRELSDLIDSQNLEGKKILNGLNKVNAQITVVQQIENKLKANRTSKSRNPVTGNWEVATLEKITDFDATKELETLKQKKVRLEDELSKINSQAKFTFDLNDTIYTRIYGE